MNDLKAAIDGLEALKTHYDIQGPGTEAGTVYHLFVASIDTALVALREKQQRERGWGCAYCVIGRRSPDARYCSNCGRKLTPALPELANESEKVNHEPKLASETAEICTLRCDYCGKYAKESDLTTEYTKDKYLICRRCKENLELHRKS